MRVYLTGRGAFGSAVASALADRHQIVGVASPAYRDTCLPRGMVADDPAAEFDRLRVWAVENRTPWTDTPTLRAGDIPVGTDVIVAAHSHAFVSRKARMRATYAIGYHPSLLPIHRGRDAVRWTIRDRDRVAGGSVYHLTDSVDAGPLAAQEHVLVPPDADARSLWRGSLFPLGVALLVRVLADLEVGAVVAVPQDETLATWEPSWDRPPMHRPELPELPAASGGAAYETRVEALRGYATR